MKIQEAIRSRKRIKRKFEASWHFLDQDIYPLTVEDILAEDWEVEMYVPLSESMFDSYCKEAKIEPTTITKLKDLIFRSV